MKRIYIGVMGLILSGLIYAATQTETIINLSGQHVNTTVVADVGKYERFTVQAVYASTVPTTSTVSDGVKESATITVSSTPANLISARAATSITISSVAGVSGDFVTLNGTVFTEGNQWSVGASCTTTAASLKNAIDAHPDFVATSVANVVFASATNRGTYANGWAATTADATYLTISSATFKGGKDAHTLTINGVTLTEGTDFTATTASGTTATAISDAIDGDSTLSVILTTSTSNNVITITAREPGNQSWYIASSTSTGMNVGAGFSNGVDSDIDISNDQFSETSHGFSTGLELLLTVTAGTAPSGLTDGNTYYAIKVNNNIYKVASSTTNAVAGTDIDIYDLTGNGTFTLSPLAFTAGAASAKWQASNDNENWVDLSVSSITVVEITAGGSELWDFDTFDYRYLRLSFKGPTQGSVNITNTLHGRF